MERAGEVNDEDTLVCLCKIGDAELRRRLEERGLATEQDCPECGEEGVFVSLGTIADVVDDTYRAWYRRNRSTEEGWSAEAIEVLGRSGQEPVDILVDLTGMEADLCELLASILFDREQHDVVREGAAAMYDPEETYEVEDDHSRARMTWLEFQREVLHERRFVSSSRDRMLRAMFSPVQHAKDNGIEVAFTLDATSTHTVYRGRIAHTTEEAERFASDAQTQLMAPPRNVATGGRMNAPGIPVLYTGFSRETCITELRPPVGGLVVTVQLEVLAPMKLLDLSVFARPCPIASKFSPGSLEMANAWSFLAELDRIIQQPVLPGDQPVHYVPTQVIAEYVKDVLRCDGLVYNSAQTILEDEGDCTPPIARNAVFFGTDVVPSDEFRHFNPLHTLPVPNRTHKLRPLPETVGCVRVTRVRYDCDRYYLEADMKELPF